MEYITLKGTKDGVTIVLSDEETFEKILLELKEKLIKTKSFFSKAKNNLLITGRIMTQTDRLELEQTIMSILPDNTQIDYQEGVCAEKVNQDEPADYTMFFEGTLRSGRSVESKGNIVVIGDVNPGAEIVAKGNVIVMGVLRGTVHAGYPNNRNAYIIALNLAPTQLRIADIITRAPDNEVRKHITTEKAYLKDDTIYIDEYLNKI